MAVCELRKPNLGTHDLEGMRRRPALGVYHFDRAPAAGAAAAAGTCLASCAAIAARKAASSIGSTGKKEQQQRKSGKLASSARPVPSFKRQPR